MVYADNEFFCHSNDTEMRPADLTSLRKIFGRGKSPVASCSGNGCYVLEKASDSEWVLHLHPAQQYLADPQRGRQFRHMANRWVSCLREPPVSLLREDTLLFSLMLAPWRKITDLSGNIEYAMTDEHSARLAPGSYRIFF